MSFPVDPAQTGAEVLRLSDTDMLDRVQHAAFRYFVSVISAYVTDWPDCVTEDFGLIVTTTEWR